MFNGKDIVELHGHFNDKMKPERFDTKQVFVSPSAKYAGNDAYSPEKRYSYILQLIFNCLKNLWFDFY